LPAQEWAGARVRSLAAGGRMLPPAADPTDGGRLGRPTGCDDGVELRTQQLLVGADQVKELCLTPRCRGLLCQRLGHRDSPPGLRR
jgi:hypothetical protein